MGCLRTILALSVVLAHGARWCDPRLLVGGPAAVQLFYLISGFVISHVLLEVPAYQDATTFYKSRALRLFPTYYAVLGLTLGWYLLGEPDGFALWERFPPSAVAFLAIVNGTLLGQDWTLFLAVQDGSLGWTSNFAVSDVPVWKGLLVPPAWTLGVELTFYLVAPWVVRRRRLLLALLALSLSARLAGVAMGFGAADPWTYRFFPFELALFLLGMISHQVVLPRWRRHLARRGRSNLPALGTYLLLAAIGVFPLIPAEDWAKRCALIVLLAGLAPLAFLFQQRSRVDQAVGELSFPLYIGHYLVLTVGIVVFPRIGPAHDVARFAVYVACSLGFAALLHVAVTRPVERVRARLRGSTKPQATSAPPA